MKIKTSILQDILSTLTSLVKYNAIKPITNLVEIYAEDNICHIGATDNMTKIVATAYCEEIIDNIVINLQDLYKLVKLTTKEYMSFVKKEDYIEIKGNGKYKISLQRDEVGNEIQLPLQLVIHTEVQLFKREDAKKVQKYQEFALCKDTNHSQLCKYGTINNQTVATDSLIMSVGNYVLPQEETPSLIISQLCKLPYEIIEYSINAGIFRFTNVNDDIQYNGQIYADNSKPFPKDMIAPILNANMYNTEMNIETKELEFILKRFNIFQNTFDVPCIYFEDNKIYNKDKTIEETLKGEVKQKGDVHVVIKIEQLLNVLRRMDAQITLYLGTNAIKVADQEKYYIISAMEV